MTVALAGAASRCCCRTPDVRSGSRSAATATATGAATAVMRPRPQAASGCAGSDRDSDTQRRPDPVLSIHRRPIRQSVSSTKSEPHVAAAASVTVTSSSRGIAPPSGVPGSALCRIDPPGTRHVAHNAATGLPREARPAGFSPGHEAGRRRPIGVVAALQIHHRATTPMGRRWAAEGGPEGRCLQETGTAAAESALSATGHRDIGNGNGRGRGERYNPPMTHSPTDSTTVIDGVTLHLARPVTEIPPWIGQREVLLQLLAAWTCFSDTDIPLNPRLLGKPGVGKTTLACAAAHRTRSGDLHRPGDHRHPARGPAGDAGARPRRRRPLHGVAPGHRHDPRRGLHPRRGQPDEREELGVAGPAARPPAIRRQRGGRRDHPRAPPISALSRP